MWDVSDKSGTDEEEFSRKVASGRRVGGTIRSLVNAKDLQFECAESCMKYCLYLFLCMAVRQCYGRKRREVKLELYRWTTSEAS